MKTFQVIFQPSGRRGDITGEKTILEASRELGVEIESLCGGVQNCGKCKIKLETGHFERYGITSLQEHLSPFTEEENEFINEKERTEGYRLACAAHIQGDVLIFVPEESRIGQAGGEKRSHPTIDCLKACHLLILSRTFTSHASRPSRRFRSTSQSLERESFSAFS